MSRKPHLPLEIILHVLESSVPPGGPGRVFDPFCPDGQLLVAWTQVCRATYQPATRLLRKHFAYINSTLRLQTFLKCLADSQELQEASTLPPTLPLSSIPFLYLGLEESDVMFPQIMPLVSDLFAHLGKSLRRLILDFPTDISTLRDEYMGLDRMLSEILSNVLTGLEELLYVGEVFALTPFRQIFEGCEYWPNLQRIAAFQVNLGDETLWHGIARSHSLKQVVITRPWLFTMDKWNIKASIHQHWDPALGGDSTCARPLSITLATSAPIIDTTDDNLHDPEGLMNVSSLDMPCARTIEARDVCGICREWLTAKAKQDTIWGDAEA